MVTQLRSVTTAYCISNQNTNHKNNGNDNGKSNNNDNSDVNDKITITITVMKTETVLITVVIGWRPNDNGDDRNHHLEKYCCLPSY